MPYPGSVGLCEVGPRDGFQFESTPIPTDVKIDVIRTLIAAGLPRIQITSFVRPKRVPQMADAEAVVEAFSGVTGVDLSGLALNVHGVERAAAAGLGLVDISIGTNERHGRDNANMSVGEGVRHAEKMLDRAFGLGLRAQLGFQTVWGYDHPGDTPLDTILDLVRRFGGRELESLSLADSTGMANPESVRRVVRAVKGETAYPLVLHLHDTRGLGLANVLAAMEEGVMRYDTSLGGLGGCPFIPGATGNVATEDVVYALDQLGVRTGVDMGRVASATRAVAGLLGRELPGKLYALV